MRTSDTKKNELKPWNKKSWVIPPKHDAAFVARMEAILDLYATELPLDEVLVCMDESNKQLIGEVKESIPCSNGKPFKEDYAYIRNGTRALFMFVAPDEGRRDVIVASDKTTPTWVKTMRYLSDTCKKRTKRATYRVFIRPPLSLDIRPPMTERIRPLCT